MSQDLLPSANKPPTKFQKGQSGNPAGRPKGSRNAISIIKTQIEGELRSQMRAHMSAVVAEMIRQALPQTIPVLDKNGQQELDADGEPKTQVLPGNGDMLKTLYKSWVSGTKASEEDAPKEKIQIVIGKLDQIPAVTGRVFPSSTTEE